MKKGQNGITLVALVITIIVLLILAGVSIAMLTGDNGILTKATKAKEVTPFSDAQSGVAVDVANYLSEYYDLKYAGSAGGSTGTAGANAGTHIAGKLKTSADAYASGITLSLTSTTVADGSSVTLTLSNGTKSCTATLDSNGSLSKWSNIN